MPRRRSPAARRRRGARTSLTLSDEWRVWVVDNLLVGVDPRDIVDTLVDNHVPAPLARAEVRAIVRSPALVACQRLKERLARLAMIPALARELAGHACTTGERGAIEERERIPADEFFRHYFASNRPVHLPGAVAHWPAVERWSPAYFKRAYGQVEVEIVTDRAGDPDATRNFERHRQKTTMAEYVDRVVSVGQSDDIYMVARNENMRSQALAGLLDDIVLDQTIFDPARLPGGTTLWFGPAGTITPLHHDTTNIFFCQIYGRKRVHLIAPFETELIERARGFYSALDPESAGWRQELQELEVSAATVELQPGDALFLPVGWWHHVKALDVSISFSLLNFRRPNAYNWYRPGAGHAAS